MYLNSLHFTDTEHGYAVGGSPWGNNGIIIKTVNGGQNWVNVTPTGTASCLSVCFLDPDNGFVVGNQGTVLHTTDGGSSWELIDVGFTGILWNVYFLNSERGFITGSYGVLLATADSGKTWKPLYTGTDNTLYDITFIDDKTGYLAGSLGTIMKTTNGGGVGISVASAHEPATMMIFPDPASEKITVNVPGGNGSKRETGLLLLYNITGQEIMRQVILNSSAELDVRSLHGGLYFVMAVVSGSSSVGKFVKVGE